MGARPSTAAAAPSTTTTALQRDRLLDRLDAVPGGGLGLVVAGAGSGKSTLLSTWMHARPQVVVVWVEADDRFGDPTVLAHALVASIDERVVGFAEQFADVSAIGSGTAGRQFVARLLVAIEQLEVDLVVVVDDAHLVGSGAAHSVLDGVVQGLPSNARMFVAARYDPPLTIHRLRLEGRVDEIRGSDLSFDLSETRVFVEAVSGIELDESTLSRLHDRTDGWAVGLQLAGLSIRHSPDVIRFVEDFDGSDVLVAQYLTREVLETFDARTRDFVMSTSILPWLSVELCGAVVDGMTPSEIEETLVRLEQDLIFIVSSGPHRRARYHHLFADLIRNTLRLEDPDRERDLRRRAAAFLAANDNAAAAVEQYLELADAAGVVRMVVEHGRLFYERNESATLVRWLRSAEAVATAPAPELGIHLLAAEIGALDSMAAAETYRRVLRRGGMSDGEQATAHALYSLLGLDDLPPYEIERASSDGLEFAQTADDRDLVDLIGAGGRSTVEFFVRFMPGVAAFHRGDLPTAIERLEAVFAMDAMQYPVWKVYSLGMLGLARAWLGDVDAAESLAVRSIELAQHSLIDKHVALAYPRHALALIALDHLDHSTAAEHLRSAGVAVEQSNRVALRATHRWLDAVRITLAEGSPKALAMLEATPPPALAPPVVVAADRDLQIRLRIATGNLLAAGDIIAGAPSISPAARFDFALAGGHLVEARAVIDSWTPQVGDRRETLGLLVRRGALLAAEGQRRLAISVVNEAVLHAEPGALRAPFLEVPSMISLLKSDVQLLSRPFVRSIVDRAHAVQDRGTSHERLIEPLTDREREVLALLPTRLTNAEMATQLYVSVNTLKTHVRHIYVKLNADGRDEAVERAAQLGIL